MKGKCESKFKYKVIETIDDVGINHYFSMISQITDKFNISKSTIYKIINNNKTKYNKKYKIEKIDKPKFSYSEIHYN